MVCEFVVKIVILLVFAFPASSLTVKNCPLEYVDASGSLISKGADAETPKMRSFTEAVIVEVTAVREKLVPPPFIVTVTSPPELVAVTPAPTKSSEVAVVVKVLPSSLTVIEPPPPEIPSITSSAIWPTYKNALAVVGTFEVWGS